MWIILPGLALTPRDYAPLAAHLPGRVVVLEAWSLPTTAGGLHQTLPQARRDSRDDGEPAERIDLIGHSIGGLAALEWAFTDRVDSLTLLDPTTLDDAGTLHLPVGGQHRLDRPSVSWRCGRWLAETSCQRPNGGHALVRYVGYKLWQLSCVNSLTCKHA